MQVIEIFRINDRSQDEKDGATVSNDAFVRICTTFECTLDDIVEIIPETSK